MSQAEVLALEIRQYAGAKLRGLVPRVIGVTAQSEQRKARSPSGARWTKEGFFEELTRQAPEDAPTVAAIYEFGQSIGGTWTHGRGATFGSLILQVKTPDGLGVAFTFWTNGTVEIGFQYMRARGAFQSEDVRLEWRDRLSRIPGLEVSIEAITKRPTLPVRPLRDAVALKQFEEMLQWVIERAASDGSQTKA
jgi:hypothetical protein